MTSLERIDGSTLHHVESVVTEIVAATGVPHDRLMLVGAEARDALHAAMGHRGTLTATRDIDIGVAVDGWDVFDAIRTTFRRGGGEVGFTIRGHPVDVIPFGAVEDPVGHVTPPRSTRSLGVQAFREVFDTSIPLRLPSGADIRIPTVPGYGVLKVFAWLDRSIDHETKDGGDLALVCWWYRHSASVDDRLYGDQRFRVLEIYEWDAGTSAIALLGEDISALLGEASRAELHSRWVAADGQRLARSLTLPAEPSWLSAIADRRRAVSALSASW